MPNSKVESPPECIRLTVPGVLQSLSIIRYVVARGAEFFGFSSEDASMIELAVDEACTNVIKHGYEQCANGETRPIYVNLFLQKDRAVIQIVDEGGPFSLDGLGEVDLDEHAVQGRKSGLGIYIMNKLMDEVSHVYAEGKGNTLELVKVLKPSGSPDV